MLNARGSAGWREGMVAVAVDSNDKGSQYALKWAIEHFAPGQTVVLIHVKQGPPSLPPYGNNDFPLRREPDNQTMDLFLPFRCFCLRRRIESEIVLLEHSNIPNALVDCIDHYGIENLVLGAPSRTGFSKLFKYTDVPNSITKMAPNFCNVFLVSKGKISNIRAATRMISNYGTRERMPFNPNMSPILSRGTGGSESILLRDEFSVPEFDIFFGSSSRLSIDSDSDSDSSLISFYENLGNSELGRRSLEHSDEENENIKATTVHLKSKSVGVNPLDKFSSDLQENERIIRLSKKMGDMESNVKRLESELMKTMNMYHEACKEVQTEKQKASDLQQSKMEAEKELEKTRLAMEAVQRDAEREVEKRVHAESELMKARNMYLKACKVVQTENQTASDLRQLKMEVEKELEDTRLAMEAVQRDAEREVEKRVDIEMKAFKEVEVEEKKKLMDALALLLSMIYFSSINFK